MCLWSQVFGENGVLWGKTSVVSFEVQMFVHRLWVTGLIRNADGLDGFVLVTVDEFVEGGSGRTIGTVFSGLVATLGLVTLLAVVGSLWDV